MVVTMQSAFGGIGGTNKETQKIINSMMGLKTEKEIVKEFFDLREEVLYSDDGVEVLDYISDFKDLKALEKKKVQYNDRLGELGVSEEVFNRLFSNGLPKITSNEKKDDKPTEGTKSKRTRAKKEQSKDGVPTKTKTK